MWQRRRVIVMPMAMIVCFDVFSIDIVGAIVQWWESRWKSMLSVFNEGVRHVNNILHKTQNHVASFNRI